MSQTTNVLLAGVGGQGVVLAAEILALAAANAGFDVLQGEVHGVAQRGGIVHSHVRYGPVVHSPLAQAGEVDALVGCEKLEALRFAHFVKPGGVIIVNEEEIPPSRFPNDNRPYPSNAAGFLRAKGFQVVAVPATERATALGEHRAANVVLLGVLSRFLDIPREVWDKTLVERIPKKFLEVNQRAFVEGVSLTG